jgi:hypothetical protein
VNNQRNSIWQFRCIPATLFCNGRAESRRAWIVSDLMMLQCVAERELPAAAHAEGPEKWRKMAVLEMISSICSLV